MDGRDMSFHGMLPVDTAPAGLPVYTIEASEALTDSRR